ncbi:MAG: alpha/beta hydrolase [Sphingomonadales bacterium]|jgi:acetyl esterase/lipase
MRRLLLAAVPLLWSAMAVAAPGDWVKAVIPVAAPPAIPAADIPITLPGGSREGEGWAQQTPDQRLLYNVGTPQLLAWPSHLPKDRAAPAVLLVPGGGFQFLAMDNEGFDVARRLDAAGLRVFIVKYRTLPIAGGFAGFKQAITDLFLNGKPVSRESVPLAVADTQAAVRLVRAQAAQWHVRPDRIGVLGFSAGAIAVLAALQADAPGARPDFAGLVYGPTAGGMVPPNAPPLFAAIAADDRFFKSQDLSLIHAWRSAGASVELHLYSGGGHGFASQPTGTTSDAWCDQYLLWLKAGKILP